MYDPTLQGIVEGRFDPQFARRFIEGIMAGQRIQALREDYRLRREEMGQRERLQEREWDFLTRQARERQEFEKEIEEERRKAQFQIEELRGKRQRRSDVLDLMSRGYVLHEPTTREGVVEEDLVPGGFRTPYGTLERLPLTPEQRAEYNLRIKGLQTNLELGRLETQRRLEALDTQMTLDLLRMQDIGHTQDVRLFTALSEDLRRMLADAGDIRLTRDQRKKLMEAALGVAARLDAISTELGIGGPSYVDLLGEPVGEQSESGPGRLDYLKSVFTGKPPNQPAVEALRSPTQAFAQQAYQLTHNRSLTQDGVPKPPKMAPQDYEALQVEYAIKLLELYEKAKKGSIVDVDTLELRRQHLINQLRKKTRVK